MLKDWFYSKAFWYNLGNFPKLPGGRDGEMWVLEDHKPNCVNYFLLYFFNWGNSKIEMELSWITNKCKNNEHLFSSQKAYVKKFKPKKLLLGDGEQI